jgi:DNA invertase Pin-like site-specific DNA recombinase
VFFRELARNVWEFQRANSTSPVRIALHQKKNNFGPALPPLGFEVAFSHDAVQIGTFDPADEPECEDKLPVAARIRNLLEDGTMRSADMIAEELNIKLATVKSVLSREKGRKWQMFGGAGEPTQWSVLRPK